MDFRNPRLLNDERAEMFLGVDARHAPAYQRADQQFQPPAPENHNAVGINEHQFMRWQRLFAALLRVVLQNKVCELFDGKTPETMRVNKLDKFWRCRDQFDRTGKWLV